MSTISNKLYVEAIDDGSTLHAQLLSDKPLSQGYTPTGCIPNWQTAANQPTIYVDLLSGTDKVSAKITGGVWTYNGAVIDFANDGRFALVNNYTPQGYSTPVPAMKITDNLATSTNVNTDTIGYTGTYTLSGNDIPFAITTFVRITGISANGIFGQIEFVDNSNIISTKGQTKTMVAKLYGPDGNEIQATAGSPNIFTTAWKMNDENIGAGQTITVSGTTCYQAKQFHEANVTDNAIISCTFNYSTTVDGQASTLSFTAYESLDDQTDPEQMYVQSIVTGGGAGLDGGGAQLRKNQSVNYHIWMGTMTDSSPDTTWTTFKIRLHNSDGNVVVRNISGLNNVISTDPESIDYGYRNITWMSENSWAQITFTFDMVKDIFSKYLTGYIKATK
jgi:hypothetical protein